MAYFWQSPLWDRLRSGEWLTSARARGYSLTPLAIAVIAVVGWIAASDGLIDRNGKPTGSDFSNVYAAEKAVFAGRDVPFYGWHYPPLFFAIAVLVVTVPMPGVFRSGWWRALRPIWRSSARSCPLRKRR
jgi:hypothetical protein